jgi:DNA replication and repair protein RecF
MNKLSLSTLDIQRFRNLNHVHLDPSERFNVISGNNGAGKTNLLESIYLFSTLRSFRTVYRKELLLDGSGEARLRGRFGGAAAGLSLDVHLTTTSRTIKKDDKEISSLSDHFYLLPMVLFHPANMALVQGGPKERRRYMDRALFQADRAYPTLLSDYNRALLSRNRLVKSKASDQLIAPYDVQLARIGAQIVASREAFIRKAGDIFEETLQRIGRGISGTMTYIPDISGDSDDLLEALLGSRKRDLDRGFTSRGPHADDLSIEIGHRAAKRFASQGQQRMAVLSMKISEAIALSDVTSRIPILLLDDISSELDRERNEALFAFLKDVGGQVFITTTHLDHVRLSDERKDFLIEHGEVNTPSV